VALLHNPVEECLAGGFGGGIISTTSKLTEKEKMPPVNDNFANRIILNGDSASTTGTNVGATGEPGEPNHAGVSTPIESAWWTWTAPESGEVTIDTIGSNYDTTLGVYTGSAVNSLSTIVGNDDSISLISQVTFTATAGTTYQIAVDGFSGNEGSIGLNFVQFDSVSTGTSDSETLFGTVGNDRIQGLGGNDTIFGSEGVNNLQGGDGDDLIYGGSQRDTIFGGDGNDTIYANEGNNAVFGDFGNDTIYSGSGNDFIDGGFSGSDTIFLGGGEDIVVLQFDFSQEVDTINNFQLGQTTFRVGSLTTPTNTANLTITQGANGAEISSFGDVLAVVVGTQASTLTNNLSEVFV
jgi:Ca2+-binding RTX toxin-like protein